MPVAALVAGPFADAWYRNISAWGQPSVATVLLPGVVAGRPPDAVRAMADGVAEAASRALTAPVIERPGAAPGRRIAPERVDLAGGCTLPGETDVDADAVGFEGADLLEATAAMNREFRRLGWSDGLPLVPPTRTAVGRILEASGRSPASLVAVLDPEFGEATVEAIAVNAAMAGCERAQFPVLLAAVRAVSQPQCLLREMQVSTIAEAPLVMVNGPAAARAGIHGGAGALGPGSHNHAAIAVGRALRLVLMNVGGSVPGRSDINILGHPLKFGCCLAEHEGASPWPPFHVERGFRPEDSAVSVVAVTGSAGVIDIQSTTPEPLLDVVASALRFEGAWPIGDWLAGGRRNPMTGERVTVTHTLLLAPDHARVIAGAGWSKADVRRYLHRAATLPVGTLLGRRPPKADDRGVWVDRPDLQWLAAHPELPVPVTEAPESFLVAVAGGPGNVSQFFWGNYGVGIAPVED